MKPVKFPEVNTIFGAGQLQYEPLPVLLFPDGQAISCWQLSEEEKARVAETGQIWLSQLTFWRPFRPVLFQPVFMTVEKADLVIKAPEAGAQPQEGANDGR